jgi:hypothetical protein
MLCAREDAYRVNFFDAGQSFVIFCASLIASLTSVIGITESRAVLLETLEVRRTKKDLQAFVRRASS